MADEIDDSSTLIAPAALTALLESRFLFVDVAAQRAKQLRRGALARLDRLETPRLHTPHKLERVAMEEVRSGLIHYEALGAPVPTANK